MKCPAAIQQTEAGTHYHLSCPPLARPNASCRVRSCLPFQLLHSGQKSLRALSAQLRFNGECQHPASTAPPCPALTSGLMLCSASWVCVAHAEHWAAQSAEAGSAKPKQAASTSTRHSILPSKHLLQRGERQETVRGRLHLTPGSGTWALPAQTQGTGPSLPISWVCGNLAGLPEPERSWEQRQPHLGAGAWALQCNQSAGL